MMEVKYQYQRKKERRLKCLYCLLGNSILIYRWTFLALPLKTHINFENFKTPFFN